MSALSPDPRPLRVGYVVKKYPRLSETFILDEILGLQEAGVEVSVFSLRLPDEGRFHGDLARVQADVRYLPPLQGSSVVDAMGVVRDLGDMAVAGLGPALRFLGRLPGPNAAGLVVQSLRLAGWVAENGVDHLHAHFMTGAAHTAYLAHLFTGVPFSVTAHAKDIFRTTVDSGVVREVASAAAAVVTVCDANRRYLEGGLLWGTGRVERVYNGVDPDQLVSASGERDPDLVVAAGRLVEKKGFHVLLEASGVLAARGVPFRLVLVGDGDERPRLEELCRRLGLEEAVTLTGALPREDILTWMGRARVLAAPCVVAADGNRDALPTVLLEALALGLPVVSTPVNGIPEIVDDGVEGLLVPEADPVALADALERLLGDDGLWCRLAGAGPAKVAARFDRRRNLPELVEVFRRAARPAGLLEVLH